jgi:hypothetical protein
VRPLFCEALSERSLEIEEPCLQGRKGAKGKQAYRRAIQGQNHLSQFDFLLFRLLRLPPRQVVLPIHQTATLSCQHAHQQETGFGQHEQAFEVKRGRAEGTSFLIIGV